MPSNSPGQSDGEYEGSESPSTRRVIGCSDDVSSESSVLTTSCCDDGGVGRNCEEYSKIKWETRDMSNAVDVSGTSLDKWTEEWKTRDRTHENDQVQFRQVELKVRGCALLLEAKPSQSQNHLQARHQPKTRGDKRAFCALNIR